MILSELFANVTYGRFSKGMQMERKKKDFFVTLSLPEDR